MNWALHGVLSINCWYNTLPKANLTNSIKAVVNSYYILVICPGNPECSGHGVCKSMSDLATLTRVNGVPTPTTYGDTPNDPATWDYDMMFGCHCDNGWIGYDCSLRKFFFFFLTNFDTAPKVLHNLIYC